jgi:hypothetical protein
MIRIIFFILILIHTPAFAFFCPNNFNQIQIGYTIEQVQQQCGKPDMQNNKEITAEGAQSWDYYITQNVLLDNNLPAQGTLKTTIVFDDEGKAINISANGLGVGNSTICGSMIQLGDTRDSVKKSCGEPAFINKQTPPGKEKKYTVNELTYGSTILIFKNGQLQESK